MWMSLAICFGVALFISVLMHFYQAQDLRKAVKERDSAVAHSAARYEQFCDLQDVLRDTKKIMLRTIS